MFSKEKTEKSQKNKRRTESPKKLRGKNKIKNTAPFREDQLPTTSSDLLSFFFEVNDFLYSLENRPLCD